MKNYASPISWQVAERIFTEIVAPVTEQIKLDLCARAFNLYMERVELGDGEAMYNVALFYHMGMHPVDHSDEEAVKWNQKAFDSGFLFAANNLYTYYLASDSEKAEQFLKVLQENDLQFVATALPKIK